MTIQTKQAKQFFAAIMAGEVSHGQVRSWSRRLKDTANGLVGSRGTYAKVEPLCEENEILDELINKVRPRADAAYAASGVAVLSNLAMTPRGRARRTLIGGQFNEECREVLRSGKCEFLLERFEPLWDRHCFAAPAWWRCYAEGVGGFSYRLLSWQTASNEYRLEIAL